MRIAAAGSVALSLLLQGGDTPWQGFTQKELQSLASRLLGAAAATSPDLQGERARLLSFFEAYTSSEEKSDARRRLFIEYERCLFTYCEWKLKHRPGTQTRSDLWRRAEAIARSLNLSDDGDYCVRQRGIFEKINDADPNKLSTAERTWIEGLARCGDRERPWFLFHLADLARLTGRWNEADERLQAAWSAFQSGGASDEVLRCYLYGEQAQQHMDLGLQDLAASSLEQEMALANRLRDSFAQFAALQHQHAFLLATWEFEEAGRAAGEALRNAEFAAMFQSVREARPRLLCFEAIGYGEAALRSGDKEELRRRYLSLSDAIASNSDHVLASSKVALLRFAMELEEWEFARNHLLAEEKSWISPQKGRAFTDTNSQEEALQLRAQYHRRRPKTSSEPELQPARVTLHDLQQSFDFMLDEWARTPIRRGGLGFLAFALRRRLLAELATAAIEERGSSEGAQLALDAYVRAQARGSLARYLGLPAPDFCEWRRELCPEGSGWLLYAGAPEDTYVFLVDSKGVAARRLEGTISLDALVSNAKRRVEREPARESSGRIRSSELSSAAAALEKLERAVLPKDILARIASWQSVTITGAESLRGLPFEALPSLAGRAITRAPSVPVQLWLSRREALLARESHGHHRIRILAAPKTGRKELTIPLEGSELEPMGRAYENSSIGLGERFDRHSLSMPFAAGEFLQIVTHGLFDAARERGAGLLVAAESEAQAFLSCEEVESLWRPRSHAPAVVLLAACGSGRGIERRGDDGANHLGGACLVAGASAVMVSSADLELQATLQILQSLHRGLGSGNATPAQALARARAQAVERGAHPFEYGQLAWVGLGHRRLGN